MPSKQLTSEATRRMNAARKLAKEFMTHAVREGIDHDRLWICVARDAFDAAEAYREELLEHKRATWADPANIAEPASPSHGGCPPPGDVCRSAS